MKRIRLLILLGMVAVALPLGLLQGVARATGGTGTTNSVSINQYAQYNAAGFFLDVGLNVRCQNGPDGFVQVQVDQYRPETSSLIATGVAGTTVVCDGRTHAVAVTIGGEGFDAGNAKATATLNVPAATKPVGTATASRTIIITVEEP
jgi:hypothetical protein